MFTKSVAACIVSGALASVILPGSAGTACAGTGNAPQGTSPAPTGIPLAREENRPGSAGGFSFSAGAVAAQEAKKLGEAAGNIYHQSVYSL